MITRLLRIMVRLSARTPLKPHQGVAVVTPANRPKSDRNRYVIEVFGGLFVLSHWFLDFAVGVGDFVIGLSQISSFFSARFALPCLSGKFPRFTPYFIKICNESL